MITRMKLEELYNKVGCTVLNLKGCDLDTWCDEMGDSNHLPDELMLFALSRTYNRHNMVLCKQHIWTTIYADPLLDMETLLSACHIHLVYLGDRLYGELKKGPFLVT